MNYKKYYNLENYLFQEVGSRFRHAGTLSVEDFFCIVIWKANRAKTKIKKKLSKNTTLAKSVKNIANDLFQTRDASEKLNILKGTWGFSLPMATAILTVLYPEEFTVYDYRVREQLGLRKIYGVKRYLKYFLPKVRDYAEIHSGGNLREADKQLWGKSVYESLLKLIR
jgi:hypothetical protein